MAEECGIEEVAGLLEDPTVRTILTATSVEPMSASELSERCGVSEPTVYRRNDSRPMLFIALGFTLTVGLPFVMAVPTLLLSAYPDAATALVLLSDISTVAGLGCILYALRMPS